MPDQGSNDKGQNRRELRFAGEIPDIIRNTRRDRTYHKGRMLGKGGFARCYELVEQSSGRYYAGKAILLKSLSKKRYSEKLALEIKIHGSLVHEHICRLYSTFHDSVAYYLVMELCSGGTLADLIKARGCLTEPEARYFMRQLLFAMAHIRDKGIIHRDLKPANVFLSEGLEVKVGDFGLATIMHSETERHTSMCGTPNYIAPEILATHIYNRFIRTGSCVPSDEPYIDSETVALARKKDEGLKRGHFYPIDIWCAGNILYCMLFGKAAFECGSIKETYKKVLTCMTSLEFPSARGISRDAEKLIRQMLNENPLLRPTPDDVLESDWMQGYIPQVSSDTYKVMPAYASSRDRDYAEMLGGTGTQPMTPVNKEHQMMEQEQEKKFDAKIKKPQMPANTEKQPSFKEQKQEENDVPLENIQQEQPEAPHLKNKEPVEINNTRNNEFNNGNEPLQLGTTHTPYQSKIGSRQTTTVFVRNFTDMDNEFTTTTPSAKLLQNTSKKIFGTEIQLDNNEGMDALGQRRSKTVLRQTSRPKTPLVVAPIGPLNIRPQMNQGRQTTQANYNQPVRVGSKLQQGTGMSTNKEPSQRSQTTLSRRTLIRQKSEGKQFAAVGSNGKVELPSISNVQRQTFTKTIMTPKGNGSAAKQPYQTSHKQLQRQRQIGTPLHVIAWVDYSNRFGFGCQLSDGTVAVSFNDGSSASVSPLGTIFEIQAVANSEITSTSAGDGISRYSFKNTPRQVRDKASLLRYFQEYLESRILVPVPTEARAPDPAPGVHLVQLSQWRHFASDLLIRLSDGTVQCNFSDHTKLILNKVSVSLIDETRDIFTYPLRDLANQNGSKISHIIERIAKMRSYMKRLTDEIN